MASSAPHRPPTRASARARVVAGGFSPTLDLRDSAAALAVVRAAQPDLVIYLAAQSFVPESFRDPRTTLDVNLYGTLNLLEALRTVKLSGRLLFVGTGEIYGLVPEADLPIDERHVTAPRNPYAVSKVAGEALCYQWFASSAWTSCLRALSITSARGNPTASRSPTSPASSPRSGPDVHSRC